MRVILEEHSPLRVELEAAAAEAGTIYRVQRDVGLSVELTPESFDDRVLFWMEHTYSTEVLLARGAAGDPTALVRLDRASAGHLSIEVAAPELKVGRKVAEEFATKFGRKREKEDGPRVCVSFWRDSSPHPESSDRFLDTVRWKDVSTNYSATTGRKLDRLMALSRPELEDGRLLLWHGKPGTGKTYALRALAHEWKQWCDIHYITESNCQMLWIGGS